MTRASIHRLWWPAILGVLAGCHSDITPPQAPTFQQADDPPRFSEWSAPVNLGPVVNTDAVDIDVAISRDGLSLYFSSTRAGGFGGFDLWVTRRAAVGEPWGEPQNLGPSINTAAHEQGPDLTRDGHRLHFHSNRPGGFGGNDIYVARRQDHRDDFGWQAPQNVGAGVNGAANDNLPYYVEDERTGARTLYFNSNRPGGLGATDFYASALASDGTYELAALVPELSSPAQDAALVMRRDGREAILASRRAGTLGAFDLWVATRPSSADPWSEPINLGAPVNTVADDPRLALSFDGTELYLTSDRPGTLGSLDLWVATRTRVRGRP